MSDAPSTMERRRSRRFAVDDGVLQVSWLDLSGKMRITRTRALNVSEEGIALQLPEPVMPLMVRFQSDRFNVKGSGKVRYCRRMGTRYIVGLEFAEGLHWRAPEVPVQEPIPVCDPEATP
jgi:hypothetical protein